jgi:hypothetical protein
MRDDLRADGVRALAALLPVGQGGEGRDAALHAARGVGVQRGLQGLSAIFSRILAWNDAGHDASCAFGFF